MERAQRITSVEELLKLADPQLVRRVPRGFLEFNRLLPVSAQGDRALVVGVAPSASLPELASALGVKDIDYQLVSPIDYRRLRMAMDLDLVAEVGGKRGFGAGIRELLGNDVRVETRFVALLDAILLDAVAERASDIHIESYEDRRRVRLRIDGDLRDVEHFHLSPEQAAGVVSVLKVSAGMDVADRRAPQGGRLRIRAEDQLFDLRVQTQPTLYGENAIVRLLPQSKHVPRVDELGLSSTVAAAFLRLLDSPAGLVLVVGPTGSGKSTTLYAGLAVLARDATRKVITVEDPIEYTIAGVQQTQVLPEASFTFSTAMRAFVREDPDVILVGEIRDGETALEALRASQTGHLVLSTLHCNDATDAVQRLVDLGMHRNSIAAELAGVFAQRLAKRICTQCRAPDTPARALLDEVFPTGAPDGFRAFRGRGCPACSGAGTLGRVAIVEHVPTSPALRAAIARGATLDELRAVAVATGLIPMRDEALALVEEGVIGFEELRTLLAPERLAPERDAFEARAKGLAFVSFLGALGRLRGEDVVERVVAALPARLRELVQADQLDGWYSIWWYRKLHEAAMAATGEGRELIREIARERARTDFRGTFSGLGFMKSLDALVEKGGHAVSLYFDRASAEIRPVGKRAAMVTLKGGHGFGRTVWDEVAIACETLLELVGAKDVCAQVVAGGGDEESMALELRWDGAEERAGAA